MHVEHVEHSQVHSKCSISVYSGELKSTRQMWSSPPSHTVSTLWILPPSARLALAPSSVRQSDLRGLESPGREPRGGSLLSAAHLRAGSFQFLSLPVVCGAPEWVTELPVPKGASRGVCPEVEAVLICPGLVWLEYSSRLRLCKQVIVQTRPCV